MDRWGVHERCRQLLPAKAELLGFSGFGAVSAVLCAQISSGLADNLVLVRMGSQQDVEGGMRLILPATLHVSCSRSPQITEHK